MGSKREDPPVDLIDLGGSGPVRVRFTHRPDPMSRSRTVTVVTLRCSGLTMSIPDESAFKEFDPDYDCDEYGVPLCLFAGGKIRAGFYHGGRQWVVENRWSAQHVEVECLE